MRDNLLDDTKPDHPVLPSEAAGPQLLDVEVGGRTHAGLGAAEQRGQLPRRPVRAVPSHGAVQPPRRVRPGGGRPPGYGFAVADGMGGYSGGEVASRMALTVLVESALQTPDWILGQGDEELARVMERTAQRFRQVDETIREQFLSRPGLRSMGTTLSVALSLADALIVAHVGDSRAYLFRGGELRPLTRDHTLGEQLVERYPAAATKLRHVLTRYIGGWQPAFEPDGCPIPARRRGPTAALHRRADKHGR